MNKRRLSIALMVVTIAAIVLFQAYWIRKSFAEESRLLTLRTNLLFRETLFKLQASKLHLDTSVHFKFGEPPDPVTLLSTVNIVRDKVSSDTPEGKKHPESVTVRIRHSPDEPSDTAEHEVFFQKQVFGGVGVAAFLSSVDSLQEPVTVKEMSDKFTQVLAKEGIHAGFVIKASPAADGRKVRMHPEGEDGTVILGFAKPMAYQVHLEKTFWLMAWRLGPQLLFSLVLVGVTILSFLLLYRNWRHQQKLIALKNDFISNITHELKTPIATVSVAVEALKEFDALKDPVRTKEYLEISTHELRRLSLLVDKVLKLSLFEKQEIELRKDEFDLKVLVEDIMSSMRLQFEKYHAKVRLMAGPEEAGMRVAASGDMPAAGTGITEAGGNGELESAGPKSGETGKFKLRADKLHLTSVIYNLLDNALKYSKASPLVSIDLQEDMDHILFSVSDNGIGIPADYRERIFEKFFRVPTGDHHNVKGYGLGLSYVAYVVKRHGGEIKVRSTVGVGSHFTIKIPRDHV